MRILIIILLLMPTLACAGEYTKIDNQNFDKDVKVRVNYDELKRQWQIEQNQIDAYLADANRSAARQQEIADEIQKLEAQGARSMSVAEPIVNEVNP